MRVRIQPRMLVYAVYLVQHEYHPQGHEGHHQGQGHGEGHEAEVPHSPTDNTLHNEQDQPLEVADLGSNVTQQNIYNQGKPNLTLYCFA